VAPGSLYAVWAWLFVCLGLCIAVLGPSIPAFRDEFSVSLATAGALFTVHSVGYFGGVLLAGPLADRRGRRPVAALGAAGLLAGTALAALAPEWGWFLAAMIPSGFGFAFVDVGLNAAIGDAVLDARRRAAVMNLLHGAFPLGTLAAPAGLALAWQLGLDWRATFLVIAALVALALVPLVVRGPKWPEYHAPGHVTAANAADGVLLVPPRRTKNVLSLLREPVLARLALVQGLYVGVELGIAGWIATYMVDAFGAGEGAGALATSVYWGGFLAGRPVMAYVTHQFGPSRTLPWLIGVAALAAGAAIFAQGALLATIAYLVTALAISGLFPTLMAMSLQGRSGDAGTVAALITAAASLGGLVWPWLVGYVADVAGIRVAMATAALPLLAMLPLSRFSDTAPAPKEVTESRMPAAAGIHS